MTSLFDDSDDDKSDFWMNSELLGDEDTTFTVATVLASRKETSDRRDAITRLMPTITIHDNDKYAIPATVEKTPMIVHHQRDERLPTTQLWATESLIDDSPTNSDNEEDYSFRESGSKENIFRASSHDGRRDKEVQNKSTAMLRNIAPSRPMEVVNQVGIESSQCKASEPNRRHSSVVSISTNETIATKIAPDIHRSHSQDKQFPTGRGANVKAFVTSALKIVADGLAPLVVESWDVDEPTNLSGKKRSKGDDENKENYNNRRKSFNIRAEMTLLQDLVQDKIDESARFRQELEESQSRLRNLQKEHAIIIQSKIILESKLELANNAESIANSRVESLSSQLQELQSTLLVERTKREESDSTAKSLEIKLNKLTEEKIAAEEEIKLRDVLQQDIDKMHTELQAIRESEYDRLKKSKLIEAELRKARDALTTANAAAAKSEAAVTSLNLEMEELKRENQTRKQNETPAKEFMEWDEASEGIEIQMNRSTPHSSNIDNINSLGAEDPNGSLCDHVTRIPLLAVLQRTPDSSSRHLSYADSTASISPSKDNHSQIDMRQPECSLCFRQPKPNGIIKRCQCGKDDCYRWAHATCLLYRKSVSSCISHPGTPAPPLPTILCDGIWSTKLTEIC